MMGGLFFIPVGICVVKVIAGSSTEVSGAAAATLDSAAIGLLDEILSRIKKDNGSLSPWLSLLLEITFDWWFFLQFRMLIVIVKPLVDSSELTLNSFALQASVGIWFSFWLDTTSLSSPHGMYIFLH